MGCLCGSDNNNKVALENNNRPWPSTHQDSLRGRESKSYRELEDWLTD